MTLNDSQIEAITSNHELIAVVAGPGSGKSRCLVERVKRRWDGGRGRNRRVVCLTFTNAGAHVMAERLRGVRVDYIGTLHGYCYRILQQFGASLGYRAGGINLISEEVSKEMLEAAAKTLGYKGSGKALQEKRDPLAVLVWKEYAHRLKRHNLIDFDTVLVDGLALVKQGAGACDDLLVDEVQDSAKIDWEIYKAIKSETKFFVGDGDQSIYAFRGAFPSGFIRLCLAPNVHVIKLEENYRSGSGICRAATELIRHNRDRIEKDVVSASMEGSIIRVHGYEDDLLERIGITGAVADLVPVIGPNEIAVICRTNFLVDQFRDSLRAAGVPVATAEKPKLPSDWAHGIDVLSMFLDMRNDLVAERVLKRINPDRVAAAKRNALDLGTWLSMEFVDTDAQSRDTGAIGIIDLLPRYGVGAEMYSLVRERRDLLPMPQPTLADLLADLWQHAAGDQAQQSEGVTVCTGHSAKGREFEAVFIPACEADVWQPKRDKDPEESRRLFFVAITRAKNELYLSYVARRQGQWGAPVDCLPCGFIGEAGL